jgi:alpha-L-arabinofuranosidase
MLGSNLPAWLKKPVFENEIFRARIVASGIRLLRIPGGSWADEYGWLSCEMGADQRGATPCRYPWAARPTDFINILRATKVEPMYIVNVNYTAQEAAALVAYHNSYVTDTAKIGVDIRGTDWYTAGKWAALRAAGGNAQPLRIELWEIGNEVYGGKPSIPGCAANGWEEVWTCDGAKYITGNTDHDGFIKLRNAMKAVDPTIKVGAVGHESPLSQAWGKGVLQAGGEAMDYFVVHSYPSYFNMFNPRKEWEHTLGLPQYQWPKIKAEVNAAIAKYAKGRAIPIVINEYETVPEWGKQDLRNYMNKHLDALFIADTIGQFIVNGYDMAAQWAVMNGKSDDYGNEFGLMCAYEQDSKRTCPPMTRQPKYYAFPLWARFGGALLPVTSSANPRTELSAYAGRADKDTVTLLVINKSARPADGQLVLKGVSQIVSGTADVVVAPSPDSLSVTFNGVAEPKDDLSDAPAAKLSGSANNTLRYTFAPYSVTLLRLNVKR